MFDLADILVLTAVGSLLLASGGVALLRLSRRSLSVMWLAAFGGTGLAWVCMVLSRMFIPHQLEVINWRVDARLSSAPMLSLDSTSWTYAVALTSLGFSIILTAVSRLQGVNWRAWFGMLSLESIGLLAVLAGNPVGLLVTWTALDLVEMLVWQIQIQESVIRRRVVISFTGRFLGSFVLIAVVLLAKLEGSSLNFESILPELGPYLILAAGLRLGVVPLQMPFLADDVLRQGIGTMLRLAPAAGALVLLARVAEVGIPPLWMPLLIPLTSIAAFYSALAWMNARDELAGRSFWVMTTAAMAVMSAIMKRPEACLAWGMVSLFSGGLIFLSSIRHRNLLPIAVLSILGISMLPFTPLWAGVSVYGAAWQVLPAWAAAILTVILLLVHSLLLVGYMRHGLRLLGEVSAPERWVWLIYPPGLAMLVLGQFAIGWILLPAYTELTFMEWLASFGVTGLVAFFFGLQQWRPGWFVNRGAGAMWGSRFWIQLLTLNWAYGLLARFSALADRFLRLLSSALEGQGGLLWALLFLIMAFSLIVQYSQFP
jgi:hypothetical protein